MTLDTSCAATGVTLGDRHLKSAHSQIVRALDGSPSLVEREGRVVGIVVKEERVSRVVQGQHSLVTPLEPAVGMSASQS